MVNQVLRDLIEERGWSASELARRLGEHRNWVIDRVTGRVQIKADELPRFAAVLGVPPSTFFQPVRRPEAGSGLLRTVPQADDLLDLLAQVAIGWDSIPLAERELLLRLAEAWRVYRRQIAQESAQGAFPGQPNPTSPDENPEVSP